MVPPPPNEITAGGGTISPARHGLDSYSDMPTAFTVEQVDKSRVSRRRVTFFSLIFLLTTLASWFMADLLWQGEMNLADLPLLMLFTVLFGNITTGFTTALLGLYVTNRGDSAR